MKKIIFMFTALMVSFAISAQAQSMTGTHAEHGDHDNHAHVEQPLVQGAQDDKTVAGDVHVSVKGLVCDFCARALEKVFGKQEAVNDIDVDLDNKLITIDFKDGQSLNDDTIRALIQHSGYNVENIHRVTE